MLGQGYELVICLEDVPVGRAQDSLRLAMLLSNVAAYHNAVESAACLPKRQPIDFLEAAQVEGTGTLRLLDNAAVHACHTWLRPITNIQSSDFVDCGCWCLSCDF